MLNREYSHSKQVKMPFVIDEEEELDIPTFTKLVSNQEKKMFCSEHSTQSKK